VLAAHSQVAPDHPDLFINLASIQPGASILIAGEGGTTVYTVREIYTVDRYDLSPVYPTTDNRLTLITCATDTWDDNAFTGRVVVVAFPADAKDSIPPYPTAPLPIDGLVYRVRYNLRVRANPDTSSSILRVVPSGTPVPVTGQTPDGAWVSVSYAGVNGWMATGYGELTSATPLPAPVAASTPTPTSITYSVRFNMKLRASPNLTSQVLTIVPHTTTLEVTGRNTDGKWVRVRYGPQEGWIATGYGNLSAALRVIPVIG
jgi:uncharacterized protein YraI